MPESPREPHSADWSGLPTEPLVTATGAVADPAEVHAAALEVLDGLRSTGGRSRGEAKRTAWQALAGSDAAWAAELVGRVLAGERVDLAALLDERAGTEPGR